MRKDGYHDGGAEPTTLATTATQAAKEIVEFVAEMGCECEPSESTCAMCAAIGSVRYLEHSVLKLEDRNAALAEALRSCVAWIEECGMADETRMGLDGGLLGRARAALAQSGGAA